MSLTPAPLLHLIDEWEHTGRRPQDPIQWPRSRWINPKPPREYRHLQALVPVIETLPEKIGRDDVATWGRRASEGSQQALEAFVASMVWGFGGTGYAAYRTNRILEANPDAAQRLHAVALAVKESPVAGYRAMANEHRLKWLGPAFGTKYLHFCSPASTPALILDNLVATWIGKNCGIRFDPIPWSTPTYERYLGQMTGWAGNRCSAVELETLVFVTEASSRAGNQWGRRASRRAR